MPLTVCSPQGRPLLDPVALWRTAAQGALDYWSRPRVPWVDAMRFAGHLGVRGLPQWSSENEIVHEWPVARLRDFSAGARDDVVPTLVLPPQAGHDSCIVDFHPDQSQMQVIRAAGLRRAWSLDWKGADATTRDAGIEDYVAVLDDATEQLGGRANLIGDCQGGWLAALYAALRPERVHTLTIAGAPIDFHAGEPLIHGWVETLAPGGDLAVYESLVRAAGGVYGGALMLGGFIALEPEAELTKQLDLLLNLDDPEHVERYRRFEDWYKHTQDIPGRLYLWIVERLFRDNALIAGELEVAGERVDLRRIECPLALIAGRRDHITPPEQVWALEGFAGTPREQVTHRLTGGGHLGLFMSHEALREHWPVVLETVRAAS